MLLIIEGLVFCLILLITCVIGIANGPHNLVVFYEDDVQERVIKLGLTTKEKIKKSLITVIIALYLPLFILGPIFVYYVNGATGFLDPFWQMNIIFWIQGLFDRIFIDWYWVGKTKTWEIPGTEDLKPYIPKNVMIMKWCATIFVYPIISAIIAYIALLF